jgi:hypothetical protein
MKSIVTIVGVIALVILLVILGPLLTIWAFNTLFPALSIPYTFSNWIAVIILGAFFRANVSIKKKD